MTYLPLTRGEGVRQPRIFDPALKQFTYAFRAGDPIFEDEETGRRRRRARREAIDHLVGIVALTLVAEPRTARQPPAGGVDRRAARDPGDLDWVVVPHDIELESSFTAKVFKGLIGAVANDPDASSTVTVDATGIRVDDIWTYDRTPGSGWSSPDMPKACLPGRCNSTSSSTSRCRSRLSRR
ncbi:hypothetical protein ACFQ0B_80250 [Nonomuraea thailandensis]